MLATVMVAAARSALDDGGDSHAPGGADRDQSALRACVAGEDLGERREDPRAGGGEGMPDADAAALHVELGAIDAAERRGQSQHVAAVLRDSQALSVHSSCAAN